MIGLISLILSGCQQAINSKAANDRGIGTQWGGWGRISCS